MQDILTLLEQSVSSIQSDSAIIRENLRAEYQRFCEDCRRDLDPIEAEFGGLPTFNEWKEYAHG